jgi:uncharacterized protein
VRGTDTLPLREPPLKTIPLIDSARPVAWLPWGREAFARAAAGRKPILLSISASWCQWCREMDRTSYASPAIARLIHDRFVPIRVDADRRPDIGERYGLGGWPTTAFLTPAGEILAGGTYVPADRLEGVLLQVADAFSHRAAEIARRAAQAQEPAAPPPPAADPAAADGLGSRLLAAFDDEHGGFGTGAKFPHVDALFLALELFAESGDERFGRLVTRSLDAMAWGGLYDEVGGGFFRYATNRDWTEPHSEKLLETNAALLPLLLDAARMFGQVRYEERALHLLRYLDATLIDPVEGGFFGSQQADDAYYAVAAAKRRTLAPPPVDRVLYTDANALAVRAYVRAASRFEDVPRLQTAIRSLERVVLASYRPGRGVAHWCFDGQTGVRGLLADHVRVAAALLDLHDASGNIVYEELAEELMHYCLRTMWDEASGGFYDRAPGGEEDLGLLRRRLKPFGTNCEAVGVLLRLAASSGEAAFRARALEVLGAMAGALPGQGLHGAVFGLATRAAARAPLG